MKLMQVTLMLFLISLLFCSRVNAGVMIKVYSEQEDVTNTNIYQDGIYVSLENDQVMSIFDSKKNQCVMLLHHFRKVATIRCDEFKKFMDSGNQNSPPALNHLKELMEAAKNGTKSKQLSIDIKKTGKTAFQGFSVDVYRFAIEGGPVAKVWLSTDLAKAVEKEFSFRSMTQIFNDEDEAQFVSTGDEDVDGVVNKAIADLVDKNKAYYLKTVFVNNSADESTQGDMSSEQQEVSGDYVKAIKMGMFDLGKYSPPKDYKEISSMQELMP